MEMIDSERVKEYARKLGISDEDTEIFLLVFDNSPLLDSEDAFLECLLQDKQEMLRVRRIVAESGSEYTPHQFTQNIKLLIYIKSLIKKES